MYNLTPQSSPPKSPQKSGRFTRIFLWLFFVLGILIAGLYGFGTLKSVARTLATATRMAATAQAIALSSATATPLPTKTPSPTDTPMPTSTSVPTATPLPTDTPLPPTATPLPTQTPLPTATSTPLPTATPLPTNTPLPTATLDPSIPRTDVESRIACDMSEYFVEQNLKSPSTAKFPNAFDYINGDGCMALFNDGVWTLSSWVDSQNSFGAMLRSHYVAQLTYDKQNETWRLQDLLFVD